MIVPLSDWYPAMHTKWQARLADLEAAGVKTVYELDERDGWVIHHTVGGASTDPLSYARQVADMHWDLWQRPGGYNFLQSTSGDIYEMCGYLHVGAHSGTTFWNRTTLGLAFQGDFRNVEPSQLMLETASQFIADTLIPSTQWTHQEVRPEPTTCPGDKLIALLPLETDMSKQDALDALNEFFGASRRVNDPQGQTNPDGSPRTRLYVDALIDSAWHPTAGKLPGKNPAKTLDWLTRPQSSLSEAELTAIAEQVVTEMTPALRSAVAAELAKLTLKAET